MTFQVSGIKVEFSLCVIVSGPYTHLLCERSVGRGECTGTDRI